MVLFHDSETQSAYRKAASAPEGFPLQGRLWRLGSKEHRRQVQMVTDCISTIGVANDSLGFFVTTVSSAK